MIYIHFPWLPPSVNDLYKPVIKGTGFRKIAIKVLSVEGRKFKEEAISYLTKTCQEQMRWFKPNGTYVIFALFGIPTLLNKGWPKTAKTKYKRVDASNRVKALEDVIAEASATDDSNYMLSACQKRISTVEETDVWIWNLDDEGCPFNAAAFSLRPIQLHRALPDVPTSSTPSKAKHSQSRPHRVLGRL